MGLKDKLTVLPQVPWYIQNHIIFHDIKFDACVCGAMQTINLVYR